MVRIAAVQKKVGLLKKATEVCAPTHMKTRIGISRQIGSLQLQIHNVLLKIEKMRNYETYLYRSDENQQLWQIINFVEQIRNK